MSRQRHKQENARLSRARSELDKGLSRRDVDRALEALLLLPGDARDDALGGVSALLADAVKTAHAGRAWGRIVFLAARVELEPRLLGDAEAAIATRWSLFWGSAMAGEWERAARFWTKLEEGAAHIPEARARALRTWLEARGAPDPDAWRNLGLPEPSAPDPRLGFELIAPKGRNVHPAPRRACDAEGALIGLRAAETWPTFASTVQGWLADGPADVCDAVRATAADLAIHEALTRAARRRSQVEAAQDLDPYEPLKLFARCAEPAGEGRPEAALLALRLCLHALTTDAVSRPPRETLGHVVRLVASNPESRALVSDSLEGLAQNAALGDALLPALEAAYDAAPSARLWALGARAATRALFKKRRADEAHGIRAVQPPAWLLRTLLDHSAEAATLAAWLERDARAAADVIDFVTNAAPIDAAARWIEATWPHADEATRATLAGGVDSILDRLSAVWCEECGVAHEGDFEGYADLSVAGQRVWERLEPVVFMHASRFLEVALERAKGSDEKSRLLHAYAGAGRGLERSLEACRAASLHRLTRVATTLRRRIASRFADDAASLARGVIWCFEHDPTPRSCVVLSEALLKATAGGTVSANPWMEKALRIARRMAGRGSGRAGTRKKARPGQVDLFGGSA